MFLGDVDHYGSKNPRGRDLKRLAPVFESLISSESFMKLPGVHRFSGSGWLTTRAPAPALFSPPISLSLPQNLVLQTQTIFWQAISQLHSCNSGIAATCPPPSACEASRSLKIPMCSGLLQNLQVNLRYYDKC